MVVILLTYSYVPLLLLCSILCDLYYRIWESVVLAAIYSVIFCNISNIWFLLFSMCHLNQRLPTGGLRTTASGLVHAGPHILHKCF
jgi:hypothetical protein